MPNNQAEKQDKLTKNTLTTLGWQVANFTALVAITSGLIALVHSPLNTMMMNQIITGRLLQATSEPNLGLLFIMRQLYTGFGSCLAGTGTRTAYISGAKKIDQEVKYNQEPLAEDQTPSRKITTQLRTKLETIGFATAMSLGELVVTQVPEALSLLRKSGAIKPAFVWRTPHNLAKLSITSAGARFCFGFINFISLCEIEQMYANRLSIEDKTVKHLSAGALSGMTAAVLSYPFSMYRDYHLSKIRVENDKLVSPGAFNLWSAYASQVKSVGFYSAIKTILRDFCVQAPLRMARTSSRFALISGVSAWCGNEPLTHLVNGASNLSAFSLFKKTNEPVKTEPENSRPQNN